MNLLKRVKNFFIKGRKDIASKEDPDIKYYDLIQAQRNYEWEKSFRNYKDFNIIQNGEKYIISTNFKSDEQKKEEISNFVQDGLEKNVDLMSIIINVGIIYELGVAYRFVPEEKKLLLFFSKE